MLRIFLSCCFAFFLLNILTAKSIGLFEALREGLLSLEASGEGGHMGKSLQLKIQLTKGKKLEVRIPAGIIFHSQDSSEQDLILIQSRLLVLEKDQKRIIKLYGMCIQASNISPSDGSAFALGEPATGKLAKLVSFIAEKKLRDEAAQQAIWAVTDEHSIASIGHPELMRFVAKLLDKPLPGYTISHGGQGRPGQTAFQDRPVAVEGTFKYQTDEDFTVSFGLYNEQGKELHNFFENQNQKRGFHKFEFYFELLHLPKGKYFVRLVSAGQTVKELEIEF